MILRITLLLIFLGVNMTIAGLDANMNNAGGMGVVLGNHLISWIVRYIIAILLVFFSYPKRTYYMNKKTRVSDNRLTFDPPYPKAIYDLLIYAASAWIVFDATWLIVREGVGLCYVGFTSYPDKLFFWMGELACTVMYTVKGILLAVVIYLRIKSK